MKNKTLEYGMKLLISVHPIEYDFMGMFGITSSSSKLIEAEFTIEKYREKDTNPMEYKVRCIPVDKSGRFGNETYYSSDLLQLIDSKFIIIL
jgi:hypothetical protein